MKLDAPNTHKPLQISPPRAKQDLYEQDIDRKRTIRLVGPKYLKPLQISARNGVRNGTYINGRMPRGVKF